VPQKPKPGAGTGVVTGESVVVPPTGGNLDPPDIETPKDEPIAEPEPKNDIIKPRDYKVFGAEETDELQKQSDDAYRNKLTKGGEITEKGRLDKYTDGGHDEVNPFLYGKTNPPLRLRKR
jgi:hypothetical protein